MAQSRRDSRKSRFHLFANPGEVRNKGRVPALAPARTQIYPAPFGRSLEGLAVALTNDEGSACWGELLSSVISASQLASQRRLAQHLDCMPQRVTDRGHRSRSQLALRSSITMRSIRFGPASFTVSAMQAPPLRDDTVASDAIDRHRHVVGAPGTRAKRRLRDIAWRVPRDRGESGRRADWTPTWGRPFKPR